MGEKLSVATETKEVVLTCRDEGPTGPLRAARANSDPRGRLLRGETVIRQHGPNNAQTSRC